MSHCHHIQFTTIIARSTIGIFRIFARMGHTSGPSRTSYRNIFLRYREIKSLGVRMRSPEAYTFRDTRFFPSFRGSRKFPYLSCFSSCGCDVNETRYKRLFWDNLHSSNSALIIPRLYWLIFYYSTKKLRNLVN